MNFTLSQIRLRRPTSIAHEGNWREDGRAPAFNEELTRTLFKGAAHAIWPSDMPAICEYLRRYKGDPWKRTAAEFDEGLLNVLIRQDGEEEAGFDEELFDEWFDLVTDPEHLRSERSNFSAAWQGAIDFKNRKMDTLHGESAVEPISGSAGGRAVTVASQVILKLTPRGR